MKSESETQESGEITSTKIPDNDPRETAPVGSQPEPSKQPPEVDKDDQTIVAERGQEPDDVIGRELPDTIQSWIEERLGEQNESYISGLTKLEASVSQVKESIDRVPVKLRSLGREIKAITTSVSDSRLADLLKNLLQFSDLLDTLVENQLDTASGDDPAVHDTYLGLRTQMRQILQLSGVTEIAPQRGDLFDPKYHRATAQISVSDAEQDKTICEVQRIGFGCGEQTIRYPEVTVYRLTPPSPEPPEVSEEDPTNPLPL